LGASEPKPAELQHGATIRTTIANHNQRFVKKNVKIILTFYIYPCDTWTMSTIRARNFINAFKIVQMYRQTDILKHLQNEIYTEKGFIDKFSLTLWA